MPSKHWKTITTIAAAMLLATSVEAADSADAASTSTASAKPDTAEMNRNLARRAHTLAVEDAIEAVLSANRLALEIRLNGRTSGRTSEGSVSGR